MGQKQVIEGYMFLVNEIEYGPTIAIREKEWDQERYERLESVFCGLGYAMGDPEQEDQYEEVNEDMDEIEYEFRKFAMEFKPNLEPGKKYRITVEEI